MESAVQLAVNIRPLGGQSDLEAAVAGSDDGSWFPEGIASMSGEQVRRIGADYRDRIASLAPTAQRITDKLLTNFRFVVEK